MRGGGHLYLDGNGEITLHLLGRLAGTLGNRLDARRHWIGIGFDVETGKAHDARTEKKQCHQDHEHPLLEGKCDNPVHSLLTARSMNKLPLVTTDSVD